MNLQTDEINAILVGYFGIDEVLASVGDAGLVSLYHTNNLQLKPIRLMNYESTWGLAICPQFSLIAVSDNGFKITIWNLSTSNDILGQYKRVLRGHEHNIPCIDFADDGLTLVSSSIDKTTRIWNVVTGELLNTIAVNPEWNWQCNFIKFGDIKVVSEMDAIWADIKKQSENPFSNRQPSFQDALPYLERLYTLFMERESARNSLMDGQRASPRNADLEPSTDEGSGNDVEIESVASTVSFYSQDSTASWSSARSEPIDSDNCSNTGDQLMSADSDASLSFHTAEELNSEEYVTTNENANADIEINIESTTGDFLQNSTHSEALDGFSNTPIGQIAGSMENIVILCTIRDFYIVDPMAGAICCIPNLFPRYHFDPSLNGMERISIADWIPELSLVVCVSQRGKIALIRLVRCEKRIGIVSLC
ncbi:hypothetical protein HDV01_005921 [Terramyces sp. JEL0728]|nr:hypothetical protein HDV01_005921 [Terramyces sp. JEL0728]